MERGRVSVDLLAILSSCPKPFDGWGHGFAASPQINQNQRLWTGEILLGLSRLNYGNSGQCRDTVSADESDDPPRDRTGTKLYGLGKGFAIFADFVGGLFGVVVTDPHVDGAKPGE